jgi:hypothetical protein
MTKNIHISSKKHPTVPIPSTVEKVTLAPQSNANA